MVRVISNSFTTPRSRHSSGEVLVDQMTAEKAVTALNCTGHRSRFSPYPMDRDEMHMEMNCDTDSSTNDSFSGGESDLDKRGDANLGEEALEMEMNEGEAMKEKRRKMRRRERNKVSAQAYRQRRKEQNNIAQKMLDALEANHKMLLEKVRHLEAEKHIVEEYLKTCVKIPWCPHHISCPPCTSTGTPTGKTVTGNITSCKGIPSAMETGSSAS
ncbi:hypothetical protein CHS0354_037541 [Potamilus streckersoni]|uniref:BZIP domain-containing protein n=1 Tax=Potamilus streckersoni TaxID=2493646 RepID=A0AAE0TBE3_9BIVA|nr:hypothetical protein CHS0354_037541 [Potamilus streckersoni]